MDPIYNPYSPGAGIRPFALVGRDEEIRMVEALIERTKIGLSSRG